MFSKCLAILALFAGLPAVAQGPAAAVSPSNSAIPLRKHGPMRLYGVPGPAGTYYSLNWSGYLVTDGGAFKEVLGSWIVPKVDCTKTPNAYSSHWVGMDGFQSNSLEGLGTEADCVNSTPNYYAWYEFSEVVTEISGFPVSPGDKMSATVSYKGSKYTLKMTNHTTGKAFQHSQAFSAQRLSAEWIVEAPCCTKKGDTLPLADFTTVFLGHEHTRIKHTNWAVDQVVKGPISAFSPNITTFVMVNSHGITKATPGGLTGDGSSFEVDWESAK